MKMKDLISSCLLVLSWAVFASPRHLQPSHEDLMADMLVLVNTSKTERHMDTRSVEEGSGYGDIIPIQPLSSSTMERMEQEPALGSIKETKNEIEHKEENLESNNKEEMDTEILDDVMVAKSFEDEGSGDNDKGIETLMLENVDNIHDSREENNPNSEIEAVLDHAKEPIKEFVNTTDAPLEDIVHAPEETGKGDEDKKSVEENEETVEDKESIVSDILEVSPEPENEEEVVKKESSNLEMLEVTPEPVHTELPIEKVENDELLTNPTTETFLNSSKLISVVQEGEENDIEENKETVEDKESVVSDILDVSPEPTANNDNQNEETKENEPEITTVPNLEETVDEDSSKEIEIVSTTSAPEEESNLPPTEESIIPDESSTEILETTSESILPSQTSSDVIPTDAEITTQKSATEILTDDPIKISSTSIPIIVSSTTIGSTTEEVIVISVDNEDLDKESVETTTILDPLFEDVDTLSSSSAPNQENGTKIVQLSYQNPPGESTEKSSPIYEGSVYKLFSVYIIAGILALILIVLVIALTMRYRHRRSHKIRTDNRSEKDTENGLLGNGKYQEDSDENNIKNNEITPLVIKNSSQINKFEKSPNFSSQKNINTAVNEKNIEKDNVLKSNQTIIEDDDDAKKCIEDEMDEQKKKSLENTNQLTPEKVVVHTRVDLDSIPKKPVIVNRNGHSYHAVPGGETET